MGKAAYDRGSASISRQADDRLAARYGIKRGAPAKPHPRPADWGDKVFQRAYKYAKGWVDYENKRGKKVTQKDVYDLLMHEGKPKCGKDTAKKIAGMLVPKEESTALRRRGYLIENTGSDEEIRAEIKRLELEKLKLFGKALKAYPSSPRQLEIHKKVEKIFAKIAKLKKAVSDDT
jgi:hypothetical protein